MTRQEIQDRLFLRYKSKVDKALARQEDSLKIMHTCFEKTYTRLIMGAEFLNLQVLDLAFKKELEIYLNVSFDPQGGQLVKKKSFLGIDLTKGRAGLIFFLVLMVIIILLIFSFL